MSETNSVNAKVKTTETKMPKKTESKTPKKTESKTPKKTESRRPKKTESKTLKKAKTVTPKNTGTKKPVKKVGKTEGKKMTYLEMVTDAIAAMKERTGSSRKAIAKHIVDKHKIDEAKAVVLIRRAIATGLEKGVLKQARPTGKGAGSFRVVKIQKPKRTKPIVKKIVKATSAGASSTKIINKNLQKKSLKTVKATNSGKDKKVAPKKIAKKVGAKTTDKKSAAQAILKVASKKGTEKKTAVGKKVVKPSATGKKAKK